MTERGDESVPAVDLPRALGLEEVASAAVIHSPKGFASREGRIATYAVERASLDALLARLREFPARGGAYKQWPADIAHWRIYVHRADGTVLALNVYGSALQSPLEATFPPSTTGPDNGPFMALLHELVAAK